MMQVVVPMSGSGERFRRAGYREPKPLLPVGGRPAIAWLLDRFPKSWPCVFVARRDHLRRGLRGVLKRLRPNARVVAVAPHKRGPVHAVLAAAAAVDDRLPTLVNYCDFSFEWEPARFERFARETGCDGALLCYRGYHPHNASGTMYAYCRERNGRVLEVREKACFTRDRTEEYASSGTYYFRSGALMKEAFRETVRRGLSHKGEYYASLAYNPLIERGADVRVHEISTFLQWGAPDDYEDYLYWHRAFDAWKAAEAGRLKAATRRARLIMTMAGRGERFRGRGAAPKPLIPVLGRPMFRAAAALLPCRPARPLLIALGAQARRRPAAFRGAETVLLPRVTAGQAVTVLAAEGRVAPEEPVLVSACDHGLVVDGARWDRLLAEGPDVVAVGVRGYPPARREPGQYSWIDAGRGGRIRRVGLKRPLSAAPRGDLLLTGTFWFRRAAELFRLARAVETKVNGELYLDSAVDAAARGGLDARVFEAEAYLGWGTPDALAEFEYWNRFFRSGK